jgi:hypothetical protein
MVVLLGAATASEPAFAQPYGPRERVQSGQVRSLGEILDNVRRQRPGNLADVQGPNIGPGGEPHYRLKWVSPNGRVEWLDTDARTGRILGAPPNRDPRPMARPNGPPDGGGPRLGPRPDPRRPNFGGPDLGPGGRPGMNRGGFGGSRPGFGGRGPGGDRFGPGGRPGPRTRPGGR